MLNNREIAALIWIGVAVLWAFSKPSARASFVGAIRTILKPQILIPIAAMLAWVGLELSVGVRFALWNPALAKGTILWTLGSAGVLLFNCTQINSDDPHFFRRTILATVGVAAFVEFFVNLYVMSLLVELVFQIVVVALTLMVAVADQKPEHKPVKILCEWILALIGLALLVFTARQIHLHWQELNVTDVLLNFALPVWLTIGLVPFLFLFSIYVAYDAAIRRINWEARDRRARWRSGFALLSALRFRTDAVRKFTGYSYFARKLGEAQTFSAARGVVAEFLDDMRRAEQAKIDEEDRLKRYSGSQELDDEGRRLDRREFAETIAALRWLATCQMGWYRRGSRYRTDILDLLGDDFTNQGLPRESGIKLHVAQDGQSWYAWRQTVTGWYFAIAAAGPPPDQWEYDGPEPPTGYPGESSSWGDGPFSSHVNRNWW